MNIVKLVVLVITGATIGLGVDQLQQNTDEIDQTEYYYMGYCHEFSFDIDHLLEHIPEEYQDEARTKLEELFTLYEVDLEAEYIEFETRQQIMDDFFRFLEENGIQWNALNESRNYRHHGMRFYEQGEAE